MKEATPPPTSILEGAMAANEVRSVLHKQHKSLSKNAKIENRRKMREIGHKAEVKRPFTASRIDRAHEQALRINKRKEATDESPALVSKSGEEKE